MLRDRRLDYRCRDCYRDPPMTRGDYVTLALVFVGLVVIGGLVCAM